MTDDELLALVADECRRSIGFDHDAELSSQREMALNYIKGEMPDIASLKNRSQAVSTDIDDAIETLLPDLVDILVSGEDVVVFVPRGEEDVEAAQQETDYVSYVVFQENDGWTTLYTMIRDALEVKTGVVKVAWEDGEEASEKFERRGFMALEVAAKDGEITDLAQSEPEEGDEEELYDFSVRRRARGRIRIMAVPPEDFTVGADTVRIPDGSYCAMRSRPRAQDLILQGIVAEQVAKLSPYGSFADDGVQQARDTVGEHDQPQTGGRDLLRRVEVVEHYLRTMDGDKPVIWRVLTGENDGVLLEKEEVDAFPFAAMTPYMVPHRFYGRSVADKLMQSQKLGTAITRAMMDTAYFALNQRMEVAEDQMTANTLPSLLRNEPGVPVLTRTGTALRPIQAGSLGFDPFAALEYLQTKAEQRTGVVRAAQGLTPDTLHETARGALALLTQSQKRVRLMARNMAVGIADMYGLVHATARKYADQKQMVRLRNKWVDVAPTSWGSRNDMTIEVGGGASGKEAELMMLREQATLLANVIAMQGGPTGPIVTQDNVYAMLKTTLEKMGVKAPEKYITDPAEAEQQQPSEPPPDPALVKAQSDAAIKQKVAQADTEAKAQKAAVDAEIARHSADLSAENDRYRIDQELELKRLTSAAELELKREVLEAELALKRQQQMAQTMMSVGDGGYASSVDIGDVQIGGEPG